MDRRIARLTSLKRTGTHDRVAAAAASINAASSKPSPIILTGIAGGAMTRRRQRPFLTCRRIGPLLVA
jgi:hypothetical protein